MLVTVANNCLVFGSTVPVDRFFLIAFWVKVVCLQSRPAATPGRLILLILGILPGVGKSLRVIISISCLEKHILQSKRTSFLARTSAVTQQLLPSDILKKRPYAKQVLSIGN